MTNEELLQSGRISQLEYDWLEKEKQLDSDFDNEMKKIALDFEKKLGDIPEEIRSLL